MTIILIGIIFLGVVLRFYRLGSVPVGFHRDEAFLGYNAYSLGQTGRDMTGARLPLHLESFLYSPAGYSYASIPFVKLFGLSAFSVRFASALFGSFTIVLTFFLTRQLFFQHKYKDQLSLVSAFLLAISPWSINLSRTVTENTLVVFFIGLGVLLCLLWIRKSHWYLLLGAFVSFGATIFMYQAPRAFLPFFIPLLVCIFAKEIKDKRNIFPILLLFFITILIPLFFIITSPKLSLRLRTVSIFANQDTQLTLDEQIREDGPGNRLFPVARAFHNKAYAYAGQVLQNYFDHFSYRFLFTENVLPMRYRVPGASLVYLFELPFLIFGAWMLFKANRQTGFFLTGWILLAPMGSALTFDDIPNLQRTLIAFPALSILSAYGFISSVGYLHKHQFLSRCVLGAGGIIVFFSVMAYLHQYYVHGVVHRPWNRQEGYEQLVAKVNQLLPSYKQAVVTNRETAPTVFFLFYGKYDPGVFQQVAKTSLLRDFDRVGFANYEFSQEECPLRDVVSKDGTVTTTGEKGILYVNSGLCKDMKYGKLIETIKRSDQTPVFKILSLD